jgi:hypothetical protein
MVFRLTTGFGHRKRFSHRRSKFPSGGLAHRRVIQQRVGELQSNQVVTLGVRDPDRSSTDHAGGFGKGCGCGQGCTGDFKRNLRRERQRTTHRNQGASGGNVQGGGELEELFSLFIPAADEYWDCQWQTCPSATLCFRLSSIQSSPLETNVRPEAPHLGGQTAYTTGKTPHERPANGGRFHENYHITTGTFGVYFRLLYAHRSDLSPVLKSLQLQAFSSPYPFACISVDREKGMSYHLGIPAFIQAC